MADATEETAAQEPQEAPNPAEPSVDKAPEQGAESGDQDPTAATEEPKADDAPQTEPESAPEAAPAPAEATTDPEPQTSAVEAEPEAAVAEPEAAAAAEPEPAAEPTAGGETTEAAPEPEEAAPEPEAAPIEATEAQDTETPAPEATEEAAPADAGEAPEAATEPVPEPSAAPADSGPEPVEGSHEAPQEETPQGDAPQEEAPQQEAPQEEAPQEEAPQEEAPQEPPAETPAQRTAETGASAETKTSSAAARQTQSAYSNEMAAVPSSASTTDIESRGQTGGGLGAEIKMSVTSGGIDEAMSRSHYLPGALEVEVDMGPNVPPRVVHITVLNDARKKPFLGGFRHKHTHVEYHHATSQTEREVKEVVQDPIIKFHRDTQTTTSKSRSQQNYREYGTQMPRADVHVDDAEDYYIVPRDEYMDSEQVHALKLDKAVVIQCYARGMFARTRARRLWKELQASRVASEAEERQRALEEEQRRQREVERRMHPRTVEDFDVLYEELEAWRYNEVENINHQPVPEEDRRAAHFGVVLKEIKLVQTIDRLKAVAAKENKERMVSKQLELMAAPKLWELGDGTVASVHTPFTTRAKELMDLYNGLKLPKLSVDDRLDVLLHVKWTVKEFESPLTLEIEELIEREADLLNRGRSDKSLEGLRRRLLNLFLDFIETPEFNPEATRFRRSAATGTMPGLTTEDSVDGPRSSVSSGVNPMDSTAMSQRDSDL